MSWIQTASGKAFDPFSPNPALITIVDIAHHLSHQCRFSGAVRDWYCVADHCIRVSQRCEEVAGKIAGYWGLLHDASEAYLQDMARPVKQQPEMAAFRVIDDGLQLAIFEKFGLRGPQPKVVERADNELLFTEKRDLLEHQLPWDWHVDPLPEVIVPRSPKEAKADFLLRFANLVESREVQEFLSP